MNSLYCQAEFTEARRLQKRIITVQARDRTELTDELNDIQFIDMKNGVDDAEALVRLNAAVHHQLKQARKLRPLWKPATPKPKKEVPPTRSADAPDVDTPALVKTPLELEALRLQREAEERQARLTLLGIGVTVIVTLLAALIGLVPFLTERAENAAGTQAVQDTQAAETRIAQGETATAQFNTTAVAQAIISQTALAQPSSTPEPSATPTETPAPSATPEPPRPLGEGAGGEGQPATLDIDAIAGATANAFATQAAAERQATAAEQERRDAIASATSQQGTQMAQATEDTARQIAQATQQAIAIATRAAELQATIVTWTPTPTITYTPSNTPTITPTPTNTLTPTITLTPSNTPTATPSRTPTATPTLSPEQLALTPVTRNADWVSVTRVFGGGESSATPVPQVRITGDRINIRSGPSESDTVVGTAAQGQTFALLEESSGWYRIGENRWVSTSVATVSAGSEGDFSGITFVLVPAGCFMMGSDTGGSDEKPVHEQCFNEPFWISKTEVTNVQYGGASTNSNCTHYSSASDQPRNCVTWFEAQAFCEGLGGRLPTEAEWEYAARGPESLVYPWGNEWNDDNAANSGWRTAAVGSKPAGASWVGALDMSGNVWEWTLSAYQPYPYVADDGRNMTQDNSARRALRGGSFYYVLSLLRAADRYNLVPDFNFDALGFRCALFSP